MTSQPTRTYIDSLRDILDAAESAQEFVRDLLRRRPFWGTTHEHR